MPTRCNVYIRKLNFAFSSCFKYANGIANVDASQITRRVSIIVSAFFFPACDFSRQSVRTREERESTALRFHASIILRRDIIPRISWRDSRMERLVNPWRLLQGAEGADFRDCRGRTNIETTRAPPRVNQPSYRASFIFNASAHFAVTRVRRIKISRCNTWCESRDRFSYPGLYHTHARGMTTYGRYVYANISSAYWNISWT